jgi:hypothetical protein
LGIWKRVSDNIHRLLESMIVKKEAIWNSLVKLGIAADLLRKVKNTFNMTINCVETRDSQYGLT